MTRGVHLTRNIFSKLRRRRNPKWISSPDYAEKYSSTWHEVYRSHPNSRPKPNQYGSTQVDFEKQLDPVVPDRGVLRIEHALIYGRNGWIFSPEGHFMGDHSWFGNHVEDINGYPETLPSGRPVQGTCLTLASDYAVNGYGHFVVDSLCRLDLFFKAGYSFSDVSSIVCPKPIKGNAERLFSLLGIPKEKCIWSDNDEPLQVDILLAPTFPGTRRNYPKWVSDYLKSSVLPRISTPSRRLYVSRSGYPRNPENENAVHQILHKYGFEIYNPTRHINSHQDFSEAEIVVGVSGSGLTGLAFCQTNTKVLELIPSDHVFPYYYTLSCAAEMQYGYLVCQSLRERKDKSIGPGLSNIHVNEEDFDNALGQLVK